MGQPIALKFGPQSSKGRFAFDGNVQVVNAYAEALVDGKAQYAMYAAPGLKRWTDLPTGPWRGWEHVGPSSAARLIVAAGPALYEVDTLGTVTEIAGLPGSGRVSIAHNALADPDVMIVADGRAWVYKAGEFSELENDFLPTLVGVTFVYGRFILAAADGRFFYTNINTTEIFGDNFYNAEGKQDGLCSIVSRRAEIWLIGTETTEIWSPTENEEDPFGRLGGGSLPIGCAASGAVATLGDDLFWIDEQHQVRRASGMQPTEISPPWVVRTIMAEPDKESIVGHAYAAGGKNWYEISGTTFTLRYSLDANHWTERKTGNLARWRGQGSIGFADKTLIGDYATGTIWELDVDHHMDGDDPVVMILRSAIVHAAPVPLSVYSLHADIVTAVGGNSSDPEVADPKAMLRISSDGGRSWSRPLYASLGKQGQTRRVIWRRLGTYERQGVMFELSISSKVAKCVMDCIINGAQGST